MISPLGWIGNIFFLYATYALGRKQIIGFYANILANGLYVVHSIFLNDSALFWLSIGLIILNIFGVWNWKRLKLSNKDSIEQKLNKEAQHSYVVEMMKHLGG